MKTITILNPSGGQGKTTLALNLTAIARHFGSTSRLLDADPDISASSWPHRPTHQRFERLAATTSNLKTDLTREQQAGTQLAIIDTRSAPSTVIAAAIGAADLLLMPCRPALQTATALRALQDIAQQTSTPAYIIWNMVHPQPRQTLADACSAADETGLKYAPTTLHDHVMFSRAIAQFQTVIECDPHCQAAQELLLLYAWLIRELSISTVA